MSDPLRYTILTQLKTQLETIAVASGYWTTVDTVEIGARAYDEPAINSSTVPWIGIIPQEETIVEELNGQVRCEWRIDILCHFDFTTKTLLGLALATEKYGHDIRKCIYAAPTLGVDEVVSVSVTKRQGCEGSVEAARNGRASVIVSILVKFLEEIDAA